MGRYPTLKDLDPGTKKWIRKFLIISPLLRTGFICWCKLTRASSMLFFIFQTELPQGCWNLYNDITLNHVQYLCLLYLNCTYVCINLYYVLLLFGFLEDGANYTLYAWLTLLLSWWNSISINANLQLWNHALSGLE